MNAKQLPAILRLLTSILLASSALITLALLISTPALAVGPEPTWGLPYRNYTSVSIGINRLHDDNYSFIKDDTSGQGYTLNGAGTVTTASLDLLLEPEMSEPGTTSFVPVVALANGTVLAVQKACHVVLIDYHNGWWGEYIHLDNIQVVSGQSVGVNTNIGYPTMNTTASCKDHTTALHVHFAFLNKVSKFVGKFIPMTNRVLCGHKVTSTGHLDGLADPYFVVPNCQTQDAAGSNLWITGHDADYHCTLGNNTDPTAWMSNQCHYFQVAINFATRGPDRGSTILVLDHGTEMATSIMNAFGTACTGTKCAAPKFKVDDPRTQFASEPLLDPSGHPLFSAIVVASDITCGGCDNNNGIGDTPDSNAINARASDIKKFYNAGGGILAFAGAENSSNLFYNFVPIPTIASSSVNPPFTLTSVGLALGLLEGSSASDDNCCPTHNTFAIPGSLSLFKIAENDNAGSGFPETLIVEAGFAS